MGGKCPSLSSSIRRVPLGTIYYSSTGWLIVLSRVSVVFFRRFAV